MKKLVFLICLLMSFNSFAIIAKNFSSDRSNSGTVNYQDNIYVNVYTATGSITSGQWLIVDTAESADNGMYVATSTSVFVKPYCIAAEAIAEGTQGKCQVYGVGSVLFAHGATVATPGEPVYVDSGTEGYVKALGAAAAKALPYTLHDVGSFLDYDASTGSATIFINLL